MLRTLWTLGLLLIALPGITQGQDNWSLSGFGSLGAGRMEDSNLLYLDYSADRWSFEGDSAFGLHLDLNLAERLSLTGQIVSRGFNWDDTPEFKPELDWLFLRYQLDANWRMRVGRMRTPLYMYSETIDVGYSYVWARAPLDVYANTVTPFSNFDGMDLAYIADWHDVALDTQLVAGTMSRSRKGLDISVDPLLGGNISLQGEDLTLRYGLLYLCTDIAVSYFDPAEKVFDLAAQFFPEFADISDSLHAENAWYQYQTLGFRWNKEKFAAIGEVFDIHNTDSGYTNNVNGWYLSVQYRFDKLTPYLVAGYSENEYNKATLKAIQHSYTTIPIGIPGILTETLDSARTQISAVIADLIYQQYTWTLGVRYDLYPNIALKAEWQYFDIQEGVTGQLYWVDKRPDVNHTSMATFVLDVVF